MARIGRRTGLTGKEEMVPCVSCESAWSRHKEEELSLTLYNKGRSAFLFRTGCKRAITSNTSLTTPKQSRPGCVAVKGAWILGASTATRIEDL